MERKKIIDAFEALACALDQKLGTMTEWTALRAIGQMMVESVTQPQSAQNRPIARQFHRTPFRSGNVTPYMTIADSALQQAGKPLTTTELVNFISAQKGVNPARIKGVIASTLSKDKRFCSVKLDDKRAWWYTNKDVPTEATIVHSPTH
jgi:hypothetical protein